MIRGLDDRDIQAGALLEQSPGDGEASLPAPHDHNLVMNHASLGLRRRKMMSHPIRSAGHSPAISLSHPLLMLGCSGTLDSNPARQHASAGLLGFLGRMSVLRGIFRTRLNERRPRGGSPVITARTRVGRISPAADRQKSTSLCGGVGFNNPVNKARKSESRKVTRGDPCPRMAGMMRRGKLSVGSQGGTLPDDRLLGSPSFLPSVEKLSAFRGATQSAGHGILH